MSEISLEQSPAWSYLSPEQQSLARDGMLLIHDRTLHPSEHLSDYSYLVFPFAKLYEGFLKQWFRDLKIIEPFQYRSDHFRIGKALSPNIVRMLHGRSAYEQIQNRYGKELADELWQTWKRARNLVFHYFPHNLRALTNDEAVNLVNVVIHTIESAYDKTKLELVGSTHIL